MAEWLQRGGINDHGGPEFLEQRKEVYPLHYKMNYLKYENVLTKGSFGLVFTVKCDIHGPVVMKEIYIPPSAIQPRFRTPEYNRTAEYSNLSALMHVRHPNIIKLLGSSYHNANNVPHNFLLFECTRADLREVIDFCKLKEVDVKTIARALFCGVRHIHRQGILHRNIRPDSIYIDDNGVVKISGFGYCYQMDEKLQKVYLGGPQFYDRSPDQHGTLHYRAPELILGLEKHSVAVDIWSVGCIIGELIVGQKLFEGEDDGEQLMKIKKDSEVFSDKDLNLWKTYPRWPQFDAVVSRQTNDCGNIFRMKLMNSLTWNSFGVSFVKRLIAINPEARMKPNRALKNKWFWRKRGEPRKSNLKHLLEKLKRKKSHYCEQQEVQKIWQDYEQDFQDTEDMGGVIEMVQRAEMDDDEDDEYMA